MERGEFTYPGNDVEIDPEKYLKANPDFDKVHLKNAPNKAAADAWLVGDEE